MSGTPLSSQRISLLQLLAVALFVSAGCMIGLFVLMRRHLLLPSTGPQAGIVQLHLVPNNPASSAAIQSAPPREAVRPSPVADMPAATARPIQAAEPVTAVHRWQGGTDATSLPHPPPDAGFQTPSSETVADFQRRLLEHIGMYRRYPAAARAARLQGRVVVMFVMNRDGTVRSASVEDGSGLKVLDQEALDTVMRAQPLPAIPVALADHLKILLPVEFSAP
jgi:periplasmic protein TonB